MTRGGDSPGLRVEGPVVSESAAALTDRVFGGVRA